MTVSEIECFLSICEHKTISRAAEELYITQPSLSSRLKTLEKKIGTQLFVRKKGSREITLTPVGKEFYKLALQYQDVINKMQNLCDKTPDSLRISSLNSIDTFLLPQVYDRFLREYPEIQLEIQNMDLTAAIKSIHAGNTDIAFTTGKCHDITLKQTTVFKEPMVLVCNKDLNLDTIALPKDLLQNQELYVEWSGDFCDWHDSTFSESHSKITVSIMAHIKQFLESKPCWAILPVSVATGLQADGKIKVIKTEFELPSREISIVTLPQANKNATIEKFYNCLLNSVSEYAI